MKQSSIVDQVLRAFVPGARGVVGLVEDLLQLCEQQRLRLTIDGGRCCVGPVGQDEQEDFELPLSKSVFRAVLARIAAICNEQRPSSVTPYHGEAEIVFSANSPLICRINFANTPDDQ